MLGQISARRGLGWKRAVVLFAMATSLTFVAVVAGIGEAVTQGRLPYSHPNNLVVLQSLRDNTGSSQYVPPEAVVSWQKQSDIFSSFQAFDTDRSLLITAGGATRLVPSAVVTPGLIEALGVMPRWGRPLLQTDIGGTEAALIGQELAAAVFGDPATAVGRHLGTHKGDVLVVGVMPSAFRFPSAAEQIWRPLDLTTRGIANVRNVARLRVAGELDRASQAAQRRAESIYHALAESGERPFSQDTLRSLRTSTHAIPLAVALGTTDSRTRFLLWVLLGAAAMLFSMALMNTAGFEVSRALARDSEYAIRAALGAPIAALFGLALKDAGIAVAGTAGISLLGAFLGLHSLVAAWPSTLAPPLSDPGVMSPAVVQVLTAGALAMGLAVLLPQVIFLRRSARIEAFRLNSRSATAPALVTRWRYIINLSQAAVSILMVLATLKLVGTYRAAMSVDNGFDPTDLVGLEVSAGLVGPADRLSLETGIRSSLLGHPTVASVARVSELPPNSVGGYMGVLSTSDRQVGRVKLANYAVDPAFFDTMGLRILRGEGLSAVRDRQVVIDERFANSVWPGTNPVGQRFRVGLEFEVIGVASGLRLDRATADAGQDLFIAYSLLPPTSPSLKFLARLRPGSSAASIESVVRSSAAGVAFSSRLLSDRYAALHERTMVAALIASVLGALATCVALSGQLAMTSFFVETRRKEIGLRMALGATRLGVRRFVITRVVPPVLFGTAVGLLAALFLERSLSAMIQGLSPLSWTTFVATGLSALLLTIAAVGVYARRAAVISPIEALSRAE